MKKLKLYLDNCCFNRPYDDQANQIISLEIEAKLYIQELIKTGKFDLTWSFILDYENEQNPFQEIKDSIKIWKNLAIDYVPAIDLIREEANKYVNLYNFGAKDSLHICSAIFGKCDYLLTTDKKMIKKGHLLENIIIINPITFISIMEGTDD